MWYLIGLAAVGVPSALLYFGRAHVKKHPKYKDLAYGHDGTFLKTTKGTETGLVDVHWIPEGTLKKEVDKDIPKESIIRMDPYENSPEEGVVVKVADKKMPFLDQLNIDVGEKLKDANRKLRKWRRDAKFNETGRDLEKREADERLDELQEKVEKKRKRRYEDDMFPGGI